MSDFKVLFLTNMVVKCAWLAGAYFLATSDHPVMAGWCIVGAFFGSMSFTKKGDKDES